MNLIDNAPLPTAAPASHGLQDNASPSPDATLSPPGPAFGQILSDFQSAMHARTPGADNALTPSEAHSLLAHGQQMADPKTPIPGLNTLWSTLTPGQPNHTGLQAISLGPQLNAITPLSPEPDTQSLEAFARSQGLDEQAVNWLFASPSAPSSSTPSTATLPSGMLPSGASSPLTQATTSQTPIEPQLSNAGLTSLDPITGMPMGPSINQMTAQQQAALAQTVQPAASQLLSAGTTHLPPAMPQGTEAATLTLPPAPSGLAQATQPLTPSPHTAPITPAQAAAMPSATHSLPHPLGAAKQEALAAQSAALAQNSPQADPLEPGQAPMVTVQNADGAAGEDAAALIKLMPAALLWALPDAKTTRPASGSATADPQDPDLQASLLRMPPPAATWMQRLAQTHTAPSLQKAKTESEISVSELDLGADFGLEALDALTGEAPPPATSAPSQELHSGANSSQATLKNERLQSPSPAPAATPPSPDSAQRSETIQNLADKMGQAVGQRILSEMEKGQWHLKLQLRPATLGHIEVEMRMRSGEFDAVFTAPQALTRDLLQDGLARLKDTLSAMGMDVANIHVENGKNNNTGGNSTPGQDRQAASESTKGSQPSAVEAPASQRIPQRPDGLDVMV
jgi:flagellar hook-length control protein FliK